MITKATSADIPKLNQLINSAYRGETSKKGWTTEANILEGLRTTEEELYKIITSNKHTILKYSHENEIIGSVLLIEENVKLYLGMLTVSPELQNSGIGKKLLHEAEIWAKSKNLATIVMTVISVRAELIAWYKRHGYQETGEKSPFPESNLHQSTASEPLEFIYLEKQL